MEDIWSPYSDHCPVGATIPLEFWIDGPPPPTITDHLITIGTT
jgi:hypothetical protein